MKRVRVQRLAGQLRPPVAARPLAACAFHSSASALAPPSAVSAAAFATSSSQYAPSSASTAATPRHTPLSLSAASRRPAATRQQSTSTTSSSSSSSPSSSADSNTPPPINSGSRNGFPSSFGGSFGGFSGFGGSARPSYMSTDLTVDTVAPGLGPSQDPRFPELYPDAATSPVYPSPLPERARQSAKLAALHARLGLSQKLPLETLARSLVDASADPSPRFNNSSLAYLGMTLMHYHVAEWLMCKYPRLPMVILHGALQAFAGPKALADIAQQWGLEQAAAPGSEVDPGLLQFSLVAERQAIRRWGYERAEAKNLKKYNWRHSISSRVVLDSDFGDMLDESELKKGGDYQIQLEAAAEAELSGADGAAEADAAEMGGSLDAEAKQKISDDAHANAVRAVVGAIYAHSGREAVRSFIRAHVMSRQLDLQRLFRFKLPTRELKYLCARENFEPPVARLESETGRQSRTPVFVVGIYSGGDKLGEGAGASLDFARSRAAMNALKAWYLYSPGENVRVPSDMLLEDAAPWEPVHIDIGEIL